MKGRNEVRFNHDQMKEVIQHYFDSVLFKEKVIVDFVEPENNRISGSPPIFKVTTKPKNIELNIPQEPREANNGKK